MLRILSAKVSVEGLVVLNGGVLGMNGGWRGGMTCGCVVICGEWRVADAGPLRGCRKKRGGINV